MYDFLTEIISSGAYGYVAIIVVLILTGSGLPLPEEVPVIVAGVLSAEGELNPWIALVSCMLGALAGDCVMYFIGYQFGISVLREHPWFARFVSPKREARAEELIQKHGLKVFFLARFLVGLRSPMFLTAGILRVPFRRFITYDALSATVVIGVFFGLSYKFADHISAWWQWIRRAELGLTIGVVVVVLSMVTYYYVRRRRRRAAKVKQTTDGNSTSAVTRATKKTEPAA